MSDFMREHYDAEDWIEKCVLCQEPFVVGYWWVVKPEFSYLGSGHGHINCNVSRGQAGYYCRDCLPVKHTCSEAKDEHGAVLDKEIGMGPGCRCNGAAVCYWCSKHFSSADMADHKSCNRCFTGLRRAIEAFA